MSSAKSVRRYCSTSLRVKVIVTYSVQNFGILKSAGPKKKTKKALQDLDCILLQRQLFLHCIRRFSTNRAFEVRVCDCKV